MSRLKSTSLAGKLIELAGKNANTQLEKLIQTHGIGIPKAGVDNNQLLRQLKLTPVFDAARTDASRARNQTLNLLGFAEDELQSVPKFAADLKSCARFTLAPAVVDAMDRMTRTPVEQVLKNLSRARPAFNHIWIEYEQKGRQFGYLVSFDPKDESFNLKVATWSGRDTQYPEMYDYDTSLKFNADGYTMRHSQEAHMYDAETGYTDVVQKIVAENAHKMICIFLLMNSRSKVLEAAPEQAARTANGGHEPASLSTIRFDLSRIMKKHDGMSSADAQKYMAETLVRGHFKVRQTGVWWWDPHLRNKDDGKTVEQAWSDQLARGRTDTILQPHRELVLPGETLPLPPSAQTFK